MSSNMKFGIGFLLSDDEIYLDSATIGKMPVSSLQVMKDFYSQHGGGVSKGTHNTAIQASRFLENARFKISNIFNVDPSKLSFLPSRETAIINALFSLDIKNEDNIITSVLEDHSILAPLIRLSKSTGSSIRYLNLEDERRILDALQEKIDINTKGVVLSVLTLGMGVTRDWRTIAKLCKDSGVPLILDISYAIGHQPFFFNNEIPDIVISSGSLGALGPQGTAFQIISDEINGKLNPLLVGSGAIVALDYENYTLLKKNSRYEPGILNIAGIGGLANSLELLSNASFEKIESHEKKLREMIVKEINSISQIELITEGELKFGPIVSLVCEEIEAHDIAIILEDIGNITVRSGALCSHLFMKEIKQDSIVQLSTHLYNTQEEIKVFNETLNSIMEEI